MPIHVLTGRLADRTSWGNWEEAYISSGHLHLTLDTKPGRHLAKKRIHHQKYLEVAES